MDANLLFWTLALLDLGLVMLCCLRGVRNVRAGNVVAHRRMMLSAAALIGFFLVAYVGKVFVLGREDKSAWTRLDYTILYVHESCVMAMLIAGAFALYRASRFRAELGPNFERPRTPLSGGASHVRAGRIAVWAAIFGFVTAGGVLFGMFTRAFVG